MLKFQIDNPINPELLRSELRDIDPLVEVNFLSNGVVQVLNETKGINYSSVVVTHNGNQANLKDARDLKKEAINEKREESFYQDINYNGFVFQGDQKSIENMKECIMTAAMFCARRLDDPENWPHVFVAGFYDKYNVQHPLGEGDWAAVDLLLVLRKQGLYDNARLHKDAISALTTIADVEAYDYSSGWDV